eukprot:3588709-Alexandrium_andersonii.AAC.1
MTCKAFPAAAGAAASATAANAAANAAAAAAAIIAASAAASAAVTYLRHLQWLFQARKCLYMMGRVMNDDGSK